jgi:hypothetical protein
VVEVVEARGGDLLGLLKGRLGGWSDRADTAQSRTDDALGDLKRGLKRLHLPTVAAEAARDRAVDAIHTLRGGLKELRETVGARLGR